EAIQQLPQSYQTLINLRFFNELTLNEVAEVTAMSEPTVRRQIKKALALLRIELGDDSHE
ncbi:MAG: sigma-70 family RNA polymerase sigma factor, partial [Erysipelothrix sp.]|nr:sigma-70 family RNA polymerase sigma factor [Erysipelothrix sp.]